MFFQPAFTSLRCLQYYLPQTHARSLGSMSRALLVDPDQNKKAHLITHAHTHPTRSPHCDLDMRLRRCHPSPLLPSSSFQPPNPLWGLCVCVCGCVCVCDRLIVFSVAAAAQPPSPRSLPLNPAPNQASVRQRWTEVEGDSSTSLW